jgi:hypothetical protein
MKILILFAVFCIPIFIIFTKLSRERRMRPLSKVLDERRFKIKGIMSTTMSGLYQGRPVRFCYHSSQPAADFGGGGGYPEMFYVILSCRSLFSFKIYKKSMKTKITEGLNFLPEVEIGDPEMDRKIVFRCGSPQSFSEWMISPEVKEKIASLVFTDKVDSLKYDDGFLGVYYIKYRSSIGPFSVGTDLKEKMTPWNVTFVLQKLQSLAQSLESTM